MDRRSAKKGAHHTAECLAIRWRNLKEAPTLPLSALRAENFVGEIGTRIFRIATGWITDVIHAASQL